MRDAAPLVSGDTVFMGSSEDFGGVNGNHLFAFAAAGCGKATCKPLRTYDVGDAGSNTTPALVGDTLLASTQATPRPQHLRGGGHLPRPQLRRRGVRAAVDRGQLRRRVRVLAG